MYVNILYVLVLIDSYYRIGLEYIMFLFSDKKRDSKKGLPPSLDRSSITMKLGVQTGIFHLFRI